jgi:protein-L-isoaspartate(D-aspartate) O-methyltransferase
MMEDTYRHKGLRKRMVETVKSKGISDEAVLEALNTIPRHYFLDKAFEEKAYEDQAMPIDEGQTISQPFTVAYQTELLRIKKRIKVSLLNDNLRRVGLSKDICIINCQ